MDELPNHYDEPVENLNIENNRIGQGKEMDNIEKDINDDKNDHYKLESLELDARKWMANYLRSLTEEERNSHSKKSLRIKLLQVPEFTNTIDEDLAKKIAHEELESFIEDHFKNQSDPAIMEPIVVENVTTTNENKEDDDGKSSTSSSSSSSEEEENNDSDFDDKDNDDSHNKKRKKENKNKKNNNNDSFLPMVNIVKEIPQEYIELDSQVERFLEIILYRDSMISTLEYFGLNMTKAPLGKITTEIVQEAEELLVKLEREIKKPYHDEKKRIVKKLSATFLTKIPNKDDYLQIGNIDQVCEQYRLLEAIKAVSIARDLFARSRIGIDISDKNSFYFQDSYRLLCCKLLPVPEDLMKSRFQEFFEKQNVCALKVTRSGEISKYASFGRIQENHRLLWARIPKPFVSNYLRNGFLMPSRNSPSSMFPFGKGITFYEHVDDAKSSTDDDLGCLLLCQVYCGVSADATMYKGPYSKVHVKSNQPVIPQSNQSQEHEDLVDNEESETDKNNFEIEPYHSLLGKSRMLDDPELIGFLEKNDDEMNFPKPGSINNPWFLPMQSNPSGRFFIVFDTSMILIRYIFLYDDASVPNIDRQIQKQPEPNPISEQENIEMQQFGEDAQRNRSTDELSNYQIDSSQETMNHDSENGNQQIAENMNNEEGMIIDESNVTVSVTNDQNQVTLEEKMEM